MFAGAALVAQCEALCGRCERVRVDRAAAAAFAATIDLADARAGPPAGSTEGTEERTAALLLCWNAINFSYYPDDGEARWRWRAPDGTEYGADDEANGVVAALAHANGTDGAPHLASPAFLSSITADAMRDSLLRAAPGAGVLPLAEERAAALRELGGGLARLGLTPLGLVRAAGGSAARFVGTLISEFRLYADTSPAPHEIGFHKRAQLCASMLHAARVGGGFSDMSELTVFADYRLPQLLRAPSVAILHLAPDLGAAIDRAEPLPPNSADEVAIRAATVVAGAVLTCAMRARGGVASDLTTAQLDYYLWKTAVARDAAGELPPFHRTRCMAY